jgi:hypothetical protein
MPEIEITPEQEERLRALQEDLASDVVGKYGHVRPRDAVEYLLDRYETEATDAGADPAASAGTSSDDEGASQSAGTSSGEETAAEARVVDDGTVDDADDAADGEAASGGDDAMLNEMMSLLDTHDDKWGESDGDERYAVDLPDGGTEQVRTKDDVKALLFKHYR